MSDKIKNANIFETILLLSSRERNRFIVNCLAIGFCSITYNLLRVNKDLLVNLEPDKAALISFLKSTFVLVTAVALSSFYPWLATATKRQDFIKIVLGAFITLYGAHFIFLGGNPQAFHTGGFFVEQGTKFFATITSIEWLNDFVINVLLGFESYCLTILGLIDTWPTTVYYVLSEIFAILGFAVLFYLHVNESVKGKELQQMLQFCYTISSQIASIASMAAMSWVSSNLVLDRYEIIRIGTLVALVFLVLFYFSLDWSVNECINDPELEQYKEQRNVKEKKANIWGAIQDLMKSDAVLFYTLCIVLYGMSMTIVEQVAKNFMSTLADDGGSGLASFIYTVMSWQSVIAILLAFYCAFYSNTIEWLTLALATPITLGILGILVFTSANWTPALSSFFEAVIPFIGVSAASLQLFISGIQPALTKVVKYVAFDNMREGFVFAAPESEKIEMRNSGDVLASRFGKAFGSVLISVFVSGFKVQGLTGPEALNESVGSLSIVFIVLIALSIFIFYKMNEIYLVRTANSSVEDNVASTITNDNEKDIIDVQALLDDIIKNQNKSDDTVIKVVEAVSDTDIELTETEKSENDTDESNTVTEEKPETEKSEND